MVGPMAQAMKLKAAANHAEAAKLHEKLRELQAELQSKNAEASAAGAREQAAIAELSASRTQLQDFTTAQTRSKAEREAMWRAELAQADEAAEQAQLQCLAAECTARAARAEAEVALVEVRGLADSRQSASKEEQAEVQRLKAALSEAESAVCIAQGEQRRSETEQQAQLERACSELMTELMDRSNEVTELRAQLEFAEAQEQNLSGRLRETSLNYEAAQAELKSCEALGERLEATRAVLTGTQSELEAARATLSAQQLIRAQPPQVEPVKNPKCACSVQ